MSGGELRRILVVDDEPDILTVTRLTLRAGGIPEVEVCGEASEVLAAARRCEPDLILLDVMMPERDGAEVLKALRDDPRTAQIAVVFITAKVLPAETNSYAALDVAGIIAKPFDPSTLVAEIRAIWARLAGA